MVVPPATATRLEAIMANLRDVEEWRASLTENQRFVGRPRVPSSNNARYSPRTVRRLAP